jgi:hypothetical protein
MSLTMMTIIIVIGAGMLICLFGTLFHATRLGYLDWMRW